MKKILLTAVAVSLAAATQVGALTVTLSTVSGYNDGGSGGEFNINPVTGVGYAPSVLVGGGFETFCLARDLSITVPGTYNATVNANGTFTSDTAGHTQQLTKGSAWLYQQFASGVLSTYRYTATSGGTTSGRAQDAANLQAAIWVMQGTYWYGATAADLAADLSNVFVNLAANAFGGGTAGLLAAMAANAAGGFNVGALNLTYATTVGSIPIGTPAQSMLTLLPDGGTTLMLMGIGFSSLALVSRKLRA